MATKCPFDVGDRIMAVVDGNWQGISLRRGETYTVSKVERNLDYMSFWKIYVEGQADGVDGNKFKLIKEIEN